MLDLEQLAKEECIALTEIKNAARQARRAEQQQAQAKAKVPYFAALASCAPAAEEARVCQSCDRCGAEFRARNEAKLAQVFEEHSKACLRRSEAQAKHHQEVCEATASKVAHAQKRVEQLQKAVDKAAQMLKAKEEAIEEGKRRKRMQQGRKNKNLKKFVYSLPVDEPEEDKQQQCTIQGCMQRLREAEKELKAGKQRARFRVETAEICKAAAEGEEHKAVKSRAAANKVNKQLKKQANYRKEHKRMSKEHRAIEKTEKSKKKGERRNGADTKMQRASFE